jgi:thiol-disulfide isomerase/thioredoxin
MMKKTWLIAALGALLTSFMAHAEKLDAGPWRFELRLGNVSIPFIIDFKQDKNGITGILRNGKELIPLSEVIVEKERISIPLQTYEMSLEMEPPKEGTMAGFLIRHNKNPKVKTAVFALKGEDERFPEEKSAPKINLTGKWAIKLEDEEDKIDSGVIVFEQKGNTLHGSILTPTGDYRYMEGFVSGNEFEAASFDGVYNYVVRGRLKDDRLEAKILSNSTTKITGSKDANAALPNEYSQTQVSAMEFTFPNLKGEKISLKDKRFKNKPVVVQFFGSWCPNCIDETNYLIPWYQENHKRGVEIIALAFERSLDHAEAKKQLVKFQMKKKVPYPLLIAGYTAEDKPMDKIKGLKNFMSFPTTVFLDKKHEVVKVHAGFTGPSTGEFYKKWKKEFNATVNGMLKK